MIEQLEAYLILREAAERAEENLTAAKAARDEAERRLVDAMTEAGVSSLNKDEQTIYLSHDLHVTIKGDAKDAALNWVAANGLDGWVTETRYVNPAKLKAGVKEMVGPLVDLDQVPPDLASMLTIFQKCSVRVRKA